MKLAFNRNLRLFRALSCGLVVPGFLRGRTETTKSHEVTQIKSVVTCVLTILVLLSQSVSLMASTSFVGAGTHPLPQVVLTSVSPRLQVSASTITASPRPGVPVSQDRH